MRKVAILTGVLVAMLAGCGDETDGALPTDDVVTETRAANPSPFPDIWSCGSSGTCLTIKNTNTTVNTSAALSLSGDYVGYGLFSSSGSGTSIYAYTGATGTNGAGAVIKSVAASNGAPAALIRSETGLGVQLEAPNNDALSIKTVGNFRSGVMVDHPGDGWALFGRTHSATRPAGYLENTSGGPALFASGPAQGTTQWMQVSDEHAKKKRRPSPYGLAAALAVQPIVYECKDPAMCTGRQLGFGARALSKVVPEATTVDANGRYMASYGTMSAVAIKAIQELAAQNAELETRLARLEAR